MAKTIIPVELSPAQEISLLNRYGRKCSPATLVKRAIAEVLKQQEENVPVFVGRAEHEARVKAETEATKQEALAKAEAVPQEVRSLIDRFRAGEQMADKEGRYISALELPNEGDAPWPEPLIAQFGGDNSQWYPIEPDEIRVRDAASVETVS